MEKNVGQRKFDWATSERVELGNGYTWNQSGTLEEIIIKAEAKELKTKSSRCKTKKWQDVLREDRDDDDQEDQACLICSL